MKILSLLIVLFSLVIFVSARYKYAQATLTQDEGAYAYAAGELMRGKIKLKIGKVEKIHFAEIWVIQ